MLSQHSCSSVIAHAHRGVRSTIVHYQPRCPKPNQTGFTFVEIMIVLVILGLLLGGVVKIQEMLVNAKVKRTQSDNAEFSSALLIYDDRYTQLPGDHDSADQHFAIYTDGINDPLPAEINGDNSGTIDGSWIVAPNSETANVWKHLRAAGLIVGDGDDDSQPFNAYGGRIGVRDSSLQILGHVLIFGSIERKIAKILEDKFDDGDPATGSIQSDVTAELVDGMGPSSIADYFASPRYFMAFRI